MEVAPKLIKMSILVLITSVFIMATRNVVAQDAVENVPPPPPATEELLEEELPESLPPKKAGRKGVDSRPTLTIKFKDGAQLSHFLANNPWMKDYFQSNLYRGLNYRIGPVFSSLGSVYSEVWSGRLLDFVVSNIVSKNPMTVKYYSRGSFASPFVVAVRNLTKSQRTLINKVLEQIAGRTDGVYRVSLARQSFALGMFGDCAVVGRDPSLVKDQISSCRKPPKKQLNDLNFEINTANFSPSTIHFASRAFGINGLLRLSFNYSEKSAQFVPSHVDVGVKKRNSLRDATISKGLAKLVPSDVFLLASVVVPSPQKLNATAVGKYLESIRRKKASKDGMPVSIGFLIEDNKLESALFIQREKGKDSQEDLLELFSETSLVEAKFSMICDTWVVTNSSVVLQRIANTCQGEEPSFNDHPESIKNAYFKKTSSMATYLSPGKMLAKFTSMGWKSLHPSDAEPKEVKATQSLLARLPELSMSGAKEKSKLRMTR